ncbi:MAG TPA: YigZ family protein [Rectinemataceae bacterium]|nr:YigZ family protein [Rectinemataceae bacterium]
MKNDALTVPLGPERIEIVVVNSRFIASLDYVQNVEEARDFIAHIRGEFPDASHHVPAFIIGGGNSKTEFCSDDGEPSGTSGRPLLAVLRGSGLGDAAIVVSRYFGGTLLGTGGLVKAYSEAGRLVLEKTRRAALVEFSRLRLDLPYGLFESFRRLAVDSDAGIAEEKFEENVHMIVEVPSGSLDQFRSRLADLSSGSVEVRIVGTSMARRAL